MKTKALEILLVEDSIEDSDLILEVLDDERVASHVNVIHNGEDAVRYLDKHDVFSEAIVPDVIILDLNLPGKKGWEVLQDIRERPALEKIPVFILTTSSKNDDFIQRHNFDERYYINKNFNLDKFVKEIHKIVKQVHDNKQMPISQDAAPHKDEIRILLIEDSIEYADLMDEVLNSSDRYKCVIAHVEYLQEALDCLKKDNSYEVILLDLFLPDSKGLETFRKVLAFKLEIPIIITTGLNDKGMALEAVSLGAQDYLVKGQVSGEHFLRTILLAMERRRLDRLKDEIMIYVNHEIRNPLTSIKESVSQVFDGVVGEINDQQKRCLDIAASGIRRLEFISKDLLDSTKLELGKVELYKEEFNIVKLLDEVMTGFIPLAKSKNIELVKKIQEDVILINADRNRLAQVLTNLINNAVKFTDDGIITINISQTEGLIRCGIIDTGCGISEVALGQIFNKFKKMDSSKNMQGTGLGLYICKSLVELHKGMIHVNSEINEGTEFSIILPCGVNSR